MTLIHHRNLVPMRNDENRILSLSSKPRCLKQRQFFLDHSASPFLAGTLKIFAFKYEKHRMKKLNLIAIHHKIIDIAKTIKILDKISWPPSVEQLFFDQLVKGNRPVLKFKYPKTDLGEAKAALEKLNRKLSKEVPSHIYTSETIMSYINAISMVHSIGTKSFEELSVQEYGSPSHLLFGSKYSHLATAKNILESYHQFDHPNGPEEEIYFKAHELKKYLQKKSKLVFGKDAPKFQVTSKILSKAAAGKTKVRLRSNALYTKYDFDQLFIHEVMTHTLTAVNGGLQTNLPLLSLGAPRTTKTQEGLATFSEVITGNMDLHRLKRIALRVMAIDLALRGADFYDLYQFFLDNHQGPQESYLSASRILRGGYPAGGITFTKDGVYLEGLIRVHSFFRWAFKSRHLEKAHLLFCGRLNINDIFLLENESGLLKKPHYLPHWYQDIDLFAGKLAFSLVLNGIDLKSVDEHYSKKMFKIAA